MPESRVHTAKPPADNGATAPAWDAALAVTYKALKAFSFYPDGHPLRLQILNDAYLSLARVARDGMISLVVHRSGFSFPQPNVSFSFSPRTRELAQELFAREIQRFVVLPDISQAEFNAFLSLLALDPSRISASGGLKSLLLQQGIANIILNEIDISAVFTRRKAEMPPPGEDPGQGIGTAEAVSSQEPGPQSDLAGLLDQANEMTLGELIVLMSLEKDDTQYRQLARQLMAKALPLKQERNFDLLFPALVGMADQHSDPGKSAACREQARASLAQLAAGETVEHLLDHLEDGEYAQKEAVYRILKAAGGEVVDAVVRRLIAVGRKTSRRSITTALLRIGAPAEPALLALLKDGRWPVVLASIAILAELGGRESVKGLLLTAYHPDNRVRMESIRALATIGGMEASTALVELLKDPNQAIAGHAITWLGNSRNQRALPHLLQLVQARDLLGKTTALKKDALVAIGRIGDRRALEPLMKLVQRRHLIAPGRWEELKLLAIEAIGGLGGDAARDYLERVARRGGELGKTASHALEALAKRNAETR